MKSAAEYYADAERLRGLAEDATSLAQRETYLEIASQYDLLAEHARVKERERRSRH